MYAGSPDILSRTPTELADGLALKELARFLERKFAPTTWFPRSGQARVRRGVSVANGQTDRSSTTAFLCPLGTSVQTSWIHFRGRPGGWYRLPATVLAVSGPSPRSRTFPPALLALC